jgi:3-deoxy-D-manno-octulosonic-acid transferase
VIVLYNLVLVVALACASPLLLVVVALRPRLRRGFAERLRPLDAGSGRGPCVWLHAASVGEVEAASPLIRGLLERGMPVIATTLTLTGRDRLRSLFPGLPVRLAPLDLPGLPGASVRRAGVRMLLLVETEIWPNLIAGAASGGAAVLIASGRISDTSLRRYRLAGPFFRSLLRRVRGVAAQSEADAERFRALGVPPDRVIVGGDLKLDRPVADPPDSALREAIGPGPLLVGGSTHPGEEEALLSAWAPLREQGLRLVLAPRHPERVPEICANLRRKRVDFGLRSEGAASADVVVLDSIGELAALYRLADVVFVGGTLAPIGGHNLVEPVQAGCVVLHGPHTHNQRPQQRLLEPMGVLRPVGTARELAERVAEVWADPDRNAAAIGAGPALEAHRGASERSLALVDEVWREVGRGVDA